MDTQTMPACAHPSATHCPYRHETTNGETLCAKLDDACPASLPDTMKHRNLGGFWSVQAQLAHILQLDIARTLHARRMDGTPTAPQELPELAEALATAGGVYAQAMWSSKGEEPI